MLSVGLFSSTQPNPTHCQVNLWTHDPTQPQPNPHTSNNKWPAVRKYAYAHHVIIIILMHIVTMQTPTVSLALLQVFTKRICQSILDTKLHIYTTCIFSHICHFRPMTRPNPLKTQIFDPFPTQPAGQPNPRTTLCQLT